MGFWQRVRHRPWAAAIGLQPLPGLRLAVLSLWLPLLLRAASLRPAGLCAAAPSRPSAAGATPGAGRTGERVDRTAGIITAARFYSRRRRRSFLRRPIDHQPAQPV